MDQTNPILVRIDDHETCTLICIVIRIILCGTPSLMYVAALAYTNETQTIIILDSTNLNT